METINFLNHFKNSDLSQVGSVEHDEPMNSIFANSHQYETRVKEHDDNIGWVGAIIVVFILLLGFFFLRKLQTK